MISYSTRTHYKVDLFMRSKFPIYLASLFLTCHTMAASADSLLLGPEEDYRIAVNNQILAKVNGKAISVLDVMKKMDMLFYRQFPEYTSSVQARYQFYSVSWKRVLQDLIDKELIMADAEESKVQVSAGDIRQEMELYFGPNIHANLDKVGLTFEEAYRMVHSDILLKRMLYLRAHMKALKQVTPQVIKKAYEEYAENNIIPGQWIYRVISIRDANPTIGAEAANQAYKLLSEEAFPLEDLKNKLSKMASVEASTSVNISDEIQNSDAELSPTYKDILSQMTNNAYSHPIAQKSRQDGSTVFRIFYLHSMKPSQRVSFAEMENQIKDKLMDDISGKETIEYIKRLRKHFDVQENTRVAAEDFKPFILN